MTCEAPQGLCVLGSSQMCLRAGSEMTGCIHLWPGALQERVRQFKEQPVSREGVAHATFKSAPFSPCPNNPSMSQPGSEHWAEDTAVEKLKARSKLRSNSLLHTEQVFVPNQPGRRSWPLQFHTHQTDSANSVPTLWGLHVSPK